MWQLKRFSKYNTKSKRLCTFCNSRTFTDIFCLAMKNCCAEIYRLLGICCRVKIAHCRARTAHFTQNFTNCTLKSNKCSFLSTFCSRHTVIRKKTLQRKFSSLQSTWFIYHVTDNDWEAGEHLPWAILFCFPLCPQTVWRINRVC